MSMSFTMQMQAVATMADIKRLLIPNFNSQPVNKPWRVRIFEVVAVAIRVMAIPSPHPVKLPWWARFFKGVAIETPEVASLIQVVR